MADDAVTTPAEDTTPGEDLSSLSYEQARDELVQTVNRLEQGAATLEESLRLWERGNALADRCEHWLTGARVRLESAQARAQQGDDGSPEDRGIASETAADEHTASERG